MQNAGAAARSCVRIWNGNRRRRRRTMLSSYALFVFALVSGDELIASIIPRHSRDIKSSMWSIGVETQDRNLTVYRQYGSLLGSLGAKRARLQAGWARCDPEGTGEFTWAWLDEAVYGIFEQGITPWLELSYGNAVYPSGGAQGPGAGLPNSTAALAGWARWVAAVAERYANVTNEFEVWNEPKPTLEQADLYASLCVTTCKALHSVVRPSIYVGALSGSYGNAGVIFLNRTFETMERLLGTTNLTLSQCVSAVTFHAYATGHSSYPDTYKKEDINRLQSAVEHYVPAAFLFQGEAGAPARPMGAGAMEPGNWTEQIQTAWDLRLMIEDIAHGRVRYSSVFTMMDICYHPAEDNIGYYGLLAATCAGVHPYENKSIDHVRPAFRAVQTVMTLFDSDIASIDGSDEVAVTLDCPGSSATCQATSPIVGHHCDLNRSTSVSGDSHPHASSAEECELACCGHPDCNCWTFSERQDATAGCWLKNLAPVHSPLLPASNLTAGVVSAHPNIFPTARVFRNVSSAHDFTHIVLWNDRDSFEDGTTETHTCKVSVKATEGRLLLVSLANGSVYDPGSVSSNGTTHIAIEIADTPMLLVRDDALPFL